MGIPPDLHQRGGPARWPVPVAFASSRSRWPNALGVAGYVPLAVAAGMPSGMAWPPPRDRAGNQGGDGTERAARHDRLGGDLGGLAVGTEAPRPPRARPSPGAYGLICVEVYGKRECGLCDELKATLLRVRREIAFDLREIDIESTPELYDAYRERIPVVFINGRLAFKVRVDEATLRRRLARATPAE